MIFNPDYNDMKSVGLIQVLELGRDSLTCEVVEDLGIPPTQQAQSQEDLAVGASQQVDGRVCKSFDLLAGS